MVVVADRDRMEVAALAGSLVARKEAAAELQIVREYTNQLEMSCPAVQKAGAAPIPERYQEDRSLEQYSLPVNRERIRTFSRSG
jgi:preprotein translocase subunit SecD